MWHRTCDDGAVACRELMMVMNVLREAGYLKVASVGLEDAGQGSGSGPMPAPPSDTAPLSGASGP